MAYKPYNMPTRVHAWLQHRAEQRNIALHGGRRVVSMNDILVEALATVDPQIAVEQDDQAVITSAARND